MSRPDPAYRPAPVFAAAYRPAAAIVLTPAAASVLHRVAGSETYKCNLLHDGLYDAALECRSQGLLEWNDWNARWDRITATPSGREWLALHVFEVRP